MLLHFINIYISENNRHECSWYTLITIVDIVGGTAINLLLLHLIRKISIKKQLKVSCLVAEMTPSF